MLKKIRKFLKFPLTLALAVPFVRRRAAFHFRHDYFSDLELGIPLGDGFWCPLPTHDSVYSFGEIFVAGEYGSFLGEMPLPARWLDIGCHTGYFTLWLAWRHAETASTADWRAFLVDADPRMGPMVAKTLGLNRLKNRCEFRAGLISKKAGAQEFALRDGMGSSADTGMEGVRDVQKIRTLTPDEILAALPPPYDLVKVDIEGAENDFLESYGEVYRHAAAILIEWHSPDREGANAATVRALLEKAGFVFVKDLRPKRVLQLDRQWYSSGVQLYRRAAAV